MSTTVVLTGLLPFIVVAASVLAFPTCWAILRLYRRAVERGMRAAGTGPASSWAPVSRSQPPSQRLSIHPVDGAAGPELANIDVAAYRRAANGPWQAAAIYAMAGMAYATVMTACWLMATRDATIVWIKVLLLFWTYFWPAVLIALLVAGYDRTRRVQLLAGYFVALGGLFAIVMLRNPGTTLGQLSLYWLIEAGPATVLLLAFLARPIRAVGPLVVVFLLVILVGSQAVVSLASTNDTVLRAIVGLGSSLGLGATALFVAMIIAGMLLFAPLGWPVLRWLGRRYERKRLSDQSITVDSLWLLFGVVQSIGLAFEAPPWILTGVGAFMAYKAVARLGFRLAAGRRTGRPHTLLLLRVFALGRRSELLFDKLRKHWQHVGSVSLIAGPDLVTTTVEPHEFLDFVTGRLGRQFVADRGDLERRFTAMDKAPDPDGRYRINEFFCRNNTWQMTMERLAAASDTVLMDLRSFSPANQGCIFELGRLVDSVDLSRVVFLVDNTTDRAFLDTTLQRLWQEMAADSPNRLVQAPIARVFGVERQSEAELRALLRLLFRVRTAGNAAG